MRLLILSPHRDDAAFSAGLLIWTALRAGLEVTIANLYTRSNYAPYLGSSETDRISKVRAEEDLAFAACLPGRVPLRDLSLLDAPLRRQIPSQAVLSSSHTDPRFQRDLDALTPHLEPIASFDLVLAPCGVGGHLDHVITREAARRKYPPDKLGFYVDIPYQGTAQNFSVATTLYTLAPQPELKERLASFYPSQIGPELVVSIGATPEQFWLPPQPAQELRNRL